MVNGIKTHWITIEKLRDLPYFSGRGGRSFVEVMAEVTMPTIANVMRSRVIRGRLYESSVSLNTLPPRNNGSQPSIKIKSALVAQDQNPSKSTVVKKNFCLNGIFLLRIKKESQSSMNRDGSY